MADKTANPRNEARNEARTKIVQAANRHAARRRGKAPYTMRHIQQAVCIVRRRRLVSDDIIVAAGYNAEERR